MFNPNHSSLNASTESVVGNDQNIKEASFAQSGWGSVDVKVRCELGGPWQTLFSFYPDEISFSVSEFIGMTVTQAKQLRHDRDVAYIRS